MRIEVEKLVYGGDGLSRVEGEVVLTPFVLPGEIADVDKEAKQSGVSRGRVENLVLKSPHRVIPGCEYFGRCGGCHYQHSLYRDQLAAKQTILLETLHRTGKIDSPPPIEVVSGEPWAYRNRIQVHFEKGRMGYREFRSHRLCPIEHCPISSPKLNECLAVLNGMLRNRQWPAFLEGAELFTNEQDVQFHVLSSSRPIAKRFFEWLKEEIPSLVPGALEYEGYRVSFGSFFQINRHLVQPLVDAVLADTRGGLALDLYAGVGLFSIPLASRFERVQAVESGTGATRDLTFNAERAGAALEVHTANVDQFLAEMNETPDLVVADPPRAGLGQRVVRRLVELGPHQITVVACDPTTLARDARQLLDQNYRLESLTLIDLFPQTFHIETVAVFRR